MADSQFLSTEQVNQLLPKQIAKKHAFNYCSRGMFSVEGTDVYTQDHVDQFVELLPFVSIASAGFDVPMNEGSESDLFMDTSSQLSDDSLDYERLGLELVSQSHTMKSAAALMQISSATMGTDISPALIEEFSHGLSNVLKRFLSVALIYGGLGEGSWKYFSSSSYSATGWDQSVSFDGLQKLIGGLDTYGAHWPDTVAAFGENAGFRWNLYAPLSLQSIDNFLAAFRGSNNGRIDCLMMNSQLRAYYLKLCRASGYTPQMVSHPQTGKMCLAHDGVPILVNDYIITCDPGASLEYLIGTSDNPERVDGATSNAQTSLYALVLGEENNGLFGVFPESFGDSPMRIEQEETSPTRAAVILKGLLEAGLVRKANTAAARMAAIHLPATAA